MTTAAPTLNPIEIFRPGRHKASSGVAVSFSEPDLAQAARVYDPALHRAPLVVGHPKTDDVAYGHVAGLAFSDATQRLVAEPAEVEPAFADLVASGRLLAVSASFYTPASPNNPVPGSYYLRHVGFLGAEAPAVKGLKRPTVSFAEAEDGVVEFGDWADSASAGLFRGLRDWLIGKFGLDEADKALPSWTVQSLADEAARPDIPVSSTGANAMNGGLSYQEGAPVTTVTQEQLAAQAAQLASDRAALDARQAQLDERDRAATHATRLAEFGEFTAGLVTAGQLLPVHQAGLVAVMASLPDAQVVEFAEGGATVNKPSLQVLKDFLSKLPKQVDFTERAGGDKQPPGAAGQVDFNDPMSISAAAVAYMAEQSKAGHEVPHHEAVAHVMRQAAA